MVKSNTKLAVVVYIPFGWDHQRFWHRRKPTEALAVPLLGNGGVLVVEPFVCPVTGWYRADEREKLVRLLRRGRLRREGENLYVLTPIVWMPVRWQVLGWLGSFNLKTMARQIRKTLCDIFPQANHVVSWFYRPGHVDFVGLAGEDSVIYECYDQHHVSHGALSIPGLSELIECQERELLSKAHIVITTS